MYSITIRNSLLVGPAGLQTFAPSAFDTIPFWVRVSSKKLPHGAFRVLPVSTAMASLMKSPSSLRANTFSGPSEERKGLLSGVDTPSISESDTSKSSPFCGQSTRLSFAGIGVLLGLILSVFFYCLYIPPRLVNNPHFDGQTLRSNGTQEFKRTVVLVSIDGLRHALQSKRSS